MRGSSSSLTQPTTNSPAIQDAYHEPATPPGAADATGEPFGMLDGVRSRLLIAVLTLMLAAAACTSSSSRSAPPRSSASASTGDSVSPPKSAAPSSSSSSTPARPSGEFTIAFAGDVHFMDVLGQRL